MKCEGLTEEQAHRRLLPPSPSMSMAGLVDHPRRVEFIWFEHRLLGSHDTPTALPVLGDAPVSLRRILLHMIEKTARHTGRLDVMRELLDGARGA